LQHIKSVTQDEHSVFIQNEFFAGSI